MTKTFSDFDKYGLEPFADQLTAYLKVESQFVEESFVLSLNSEFGSGKSTFFEMWANKLGAADAPFKVVYINAWESDFQGDPLLAIVSYLLDILKPSKNTETIKETAGKLGKFALCIGNDVVQRFTGVDVIKAGQYAESTDGIAKPEIGHACFQLYQERQKLFEELKTLLRDLTEKSENSILVIIDELDRCRPNYAIEFLETIKHFFDISGLIFVIGVDKTQLASSAKALFGQQLDFNEYYRKFAHRHVNLPVKSQPMTDYFCRKLVTEYLSEEAFGKKNRFPYAKLDRFRTDNIVELCVAFSLNARQIHEFFRTTAHVLSTTKKTDSELPWGKQIGTFFMTALSIKNPDFYHKIGSREISLSEFTIYIKELSLLKGDHSFWWAVLLYLGAFSDQPSDKLEQEFQKLGVWESSGEKEAFQNELNKFADAFDRWGRGHGSAFSEIYQTLEGLKTFAER
ncbi:MAG: P-loop NTPase fold protein [Planctomycetota bacterium]